MLNAFPVGFYRLSFAHGVLVIDKVLFSLNAFTPGVDVADKIVD